MPCDGGPHTVPRKPSRLQGVTTVAGHYSVFRSCGPIKAWLECGGPLPAPGPLLLYRGTGGTRSALTCSMTLHIQRTATVWR
jgi:hypothetical protein